MSNLPDQDYEADPDGNQEDMDDIQEDAASVAGQGNQDINVVSDPSTDDQEDQEGDAQIQSDESVASWDAYCDNLKHEIKEANEEVDAEELTEPRKKKMKVMDGSSDDDSTAGTIMEASGSGESSEEKGIIRANKGGTETDVENETQEKFQQDTELNKEKLKEVLKKEQKLLLVLNLEHTLINTVDVDDLIDEEQYLLDPSEEVEDLFKVDGDDKLMKLRPFARTFSTEIQAMFEMYMYTTGEEVYAEELAKLLNIQGLIIPKNAIRDIVTDADESILLIADTEEDWGDLKENLIVLQRYHYFDESVEMNDSDFKPPSVLRKDESEGFLARILNVLRRVHEAFFDQEDTTELANRDVRQILSAIRKKILEGCNILVSEDPIRKLAEDMGARCFSDVDDTVTHVMATDSTAMMAEWAGDNNKFLVTPQWIQMAHYLWQRQKEEDFPVA